MSKQEIINFRELLGNKSTDTVFKFHLYVSSRMNDRMHESNPYKILSLDDEDIEYLNKKYLNKLPILIQAEIDNLNKQLKELSNE